MKKIWSTYKSTILLIGALIIGAIVGLVFGDKAKVLSPFGDLFMNLMFVIIVPLIFLTITTSIAKIKQPKRLENLSTFADIGATIAENFAVNKPSIGTSFLKKLK